MPSRIETGPPPQAASTVPRLLLKLCNKGKIVHKVEQQLPFISEVVEDQPFGYAAFGGNFFGCRCMISLMGEQLQSSVQYPFLLGISIGCRHRQMASFIM